MKHLFLLAICLSFTARAELMWLRNHGAWEAVVRVKKEDPVYEIGDFRAVTNGLECGYVTTVTTVAVYRVAYDKQYLGGQRNDILYRETLVRYAYGESALAELTNSLARNATSITFAISFEKYAYHPSTSGYSRTVQLPCRFGVPQTITVDPPYTDLLEMLPLNWTETYTRVRTGFDGYLLIRFDEREMRLTIKRLLPEKLPYEHPRRNIRVLRDDLLNGV